MSRKASEGKEKEFVIAVTGPEDSIQHAVTSYFVEWVSHHHPESGAEGMAPAIAQDKARTFKRRADAENAAIDLRNFFGNYFTITVMPNE